MLPHRKIVRLGFVRFLRLPYHRTMANNTLTTDYSFVEAKLLLACVEKAGTWAQLSRELPMSPSHLAAVKKGRSRVGTDLFCRMLEYSGLLKGLEKKIERKLPATASVDGASFGESGESASPSEQTIN